MRKNAIIFDLEATCWDKKDTQLISEIIEIGAVKVDLENNVIIEEFQLFIKPLMNPTLSKFCKTLTHIRQSDVDTGTSFENGLNLFNKFIGNEKILSWGFYDKSQVERESFLKKYNGELLTKLKKNHVSFKHEFGKIFNMNPAPGVSKALSMLNLKFEGTQHRGIDDAKNIAKILFETKEKIKF